MNKTTYEEFLRENGELIYTNVGVSMLPLLRQGKDLFKVAKKGEERCRKYDVILYRRPPNSYVLHRIVKVLPDGYVVLGDNCLNKEYGIKDADIIGVMTSFVRKGKEHSTKETGYLLYSRFWYAIYPLRRFVMKLKAKTRKLIKK